MRTTVFLMTTLVFAWVTAGAAEAQQEQWLSYRCSADADLVVGATPGQDLEVSEERPADLKLPELKGRHALFGKWTTPMVKAGFLWVVLDASGVNGPYDRLLIDANADGSLADETPIAAAAPRAYRDRQSATFPQVKVLLPGEDGPITYHLNFDLWIAGPEGRRFSAQAGGWYEGTLRIGDDKYKTVVFDTNANGAFDDKGSTGAWGTDGAGRNAKPLGCDLIKLDGPGGFLIAPVGNFIQIGGRFHGLKVSRDGAMVQVGKPEDVKLGTVRAAVDQLSVNGENGLFVVGLSDGQARLPVGKYDVIQWEQRRKDASGAAWRLVAVGVNAKVDVAADKPASLDVGEPVAATMNWALLAPPAGGSTRVASVPNATATSAGTGQRQWVFSDPRISGRRGETVGIFQNEGRGPTPQVRITNADATYDKTFTFEYG